MNHGPDETLVFVLDANDCRIIKTDGCGAMTLLAVMSEDPTTWNDVVGFWPRYHTPEVPESIDAYQCQLVDRSEVDMDFLQQFENLPWMFLDIHQKRLLTSAQWEDVRSTITLTFSTGRGRYESPSSQLTRIELGNAGAISGPSEKGSKDQLRVTGSPRREALNALEAAFGEARLDMSEEFYKGVWNELPLNLAPWWELTHRADMTQIFATRKSPLQIHEVNREVLYGEPMIDFVAKEVLEVVTSDRWLRLADHVDNAFDPDSELKAVTIELHRDWLMTARQDLGGQYPRQQLHGPHGWVEELANGQMSRSFHDYPVLAIPESSTGYATAPMGLDEVIQYFHLCRELIEVAWIWAEKNAPFLNFDDRARCMAALKAFLFYYKNVFLETPLQDGDSLPMFLIECSRRRVPADSESPIAGFSSKVGQRSVSCDTLNDVLGAGIAEDIPTFSSPSNVDCDCFICRVMMGGELVPAELKALFSRPPTPRRNFHSSSSLDALEADGEWAFSAFDDFEIWKRCQPQSAHRQREIEASDQIGSESIGGTVKTNLERRRPKQQTRKSAKSKRKQKQQKRAEKARLKRLKRKRSALTRGTRNRSIDGGHVQSTCGNDTVPCNAKDPGSIGSVEHDLVSGLDPNSGIESIPFEDDPVNEIEANDLGQSEGESIGMLDGLGSPDVVDDTAGFDDVAGLDLVIGTEPYGAWEDPSDSAWEGFYSDDIEQGGPLALLTDVFRFSELLECIKDHGAEPSSTRKLEDLYLRFKGCLLGNKTQGDHSPSNRTKGIDSVADGSVKDDLPKSDFLDGAPLEAADLHFIDVGEPRLSYPNAVGLGRELCDQLEGLTESCPSLIPRIADYQSRIEEELRRESQP